MNIEHKNIKKIIEEQSWGGEGRGRERGGNGGIKEREDK